MSHVHICIEVGIVVAVDNDVAVAVDIDNVDIAVVDNTVVEAIGYYYYWQHIHQAVDKSVVIADNQDGI